MLNFSISGLYPAEYLNLLMELNKSATCILSKHELPQNTDIIKKSYIPASKVVQIMQDIWVESNFDITLGMRAAENISITSFGSFGQAFLSCSDLGNSVHFIYKYWQLVGRGINIQLITNKDKICLLFESDPVFESYLSQWFIESAIFTILKTFKSLSNEIASQINVNLMFEKHNILDLFSSTQINFNAIENSIIISKNMLSYKFPFSNSFAYNNYIKDCQIQVNLLKDSLPIDTLIWDFLKLHTRTLRRKLSHLGKNYTDLINSRKKLDSIDLLLNTNLKLKNISDLLGYCDESNFSHAFRKWTGKSPSSFRKKEGINV
ncbi:AraC family transcriptional regulator [Acinetobacter sp. Ver3]|uniref:AraC family transcriptional regulator n=1 Tax=Acinetobacter sp. Ver3 TaxID=466088 RepID=UPI0004468377|nr:AraC family transcriptional regulator [Acinetobacter sp. Ver3]EZQ00924.1 hypothetical protein CL42_16525 [Acinetobacter sp. Ver3]